MTLSSRYRIKPGRRVSLARHDPADTGGTIDKEAAKLEFHEDLSRLADAQERLYAQNSWAVLVVFQAMDGAGKDSTIKHVMSGVNPQGCQVFAFKQPSDEELDHDYLWRSVKALPERGRIGIHNRSYYEEVVITRVHPEIVARQRLPGLQAGPRLWRRRFREINTFERFLVDNGTLVLKFFLNVSKDEQRRRFLERIDEPEKHWKFSPRDVQERGHWDDYMAAYEDLLTHTSTTWAPWYVIPADRKWFTRAAVADIISDALHHLKLEYPVVSPEVKRAWGTARQALMKEERL